MKNPNDTAIIVKAKFRNDLEKYLNAEKIPFEYDSKWNNKKMKALVFKSAEDAETAIKFYKKLKIDEFED